jgi:hypothetical protein
MNGELVPFPQPPRSTPEESKLVNNLITWHQRNVREAIRSIARILAKTHNPKERENLQDMLAKLGTSRGRVNAHGQAYSQKGKPMTLAFITKEIDVIKSIYREVTGKELGNEATDTPAATESDADRSNVVRLAEFRGKKS